MCDDVRKIFHEQLLKYMKLRGKTQSDISKDLNISLTTVSGWYLGKNFPRPDKMQLLADYLHIQVEDLITRKEDIPTHFDNAQEAIEFIIRQPMVADFGGYDLDLMSDEEILDMANDLADMLKIMAKKHKRNG